MRERENLDSPNEGFYHHLLEGSFAGLQRLNDGRFPERNESHYLQTVANPELSLASKFKTFLACTFLSVY